MHILHGTWLPDYNQFAFWGEDTTRGVDAPTASRDGAPHPFALSQHYILDYLDWISKNTYPNGLKSPAAIWLPSSASQPAPSPEALSAGMRPVDGAVALRKWTVNPVVLSAGDALTILLKLPPPHRRDPSVIIGADVAFWQQVALFLMNTVIAGGYVPSLERAGQRFATAWRVQPDPDLAAQFARSMPPLCRAIATSPGVAPKPPPLLEHFMQTTLESHVRAVAGGHTSPDPVINAFTSDDHAVKGIPPGKLAKRFEGWQAWLNPLIDQQRGGTFRVCFRLDEPPLDDNAGNRWRLAYMLQATDDTSLLLDAINVWKATGHTLHYLNRRFDAPQENLLMALGKAAQIFPPINRSLIETSPLGVTLTSEEAAQFLNDATPRLERAGFGVLVPNWWSRRAALKARAKFKGEDTGNYGLLNRNTLVNYSWEVSVGDETMNRAEFEQLVSLKQPFVRLHGQWVALDPVHIGAALEFLQQRPDGKVTLGEAMNVISDNTVVQGVEIQPIQAEGWIEELLTKLRNPELASVPPIPTGLNATLRPYQERGFGWLVQMRKLSLGAVLADQMGLGKTIQNITVWLYERESMGVDRPALLVAPTSVVGNWQHELTKFAPSLRVHVHQGAERVQGDVFGKLLADKDVVLTSYALLSRDLATLQPVAWSSVTLDEAQNIKNPETKVAQAARALKADARLAMTGTPIENRLTELWSIMHFLNPGYLGSLEQFRQRFAIPIERYGDEKAASSLRRITAPFILRRLKTDQKIISDLPDKFENKVYCTLTHEQATLYEAVVREELEALERTEDPMARRGGVLRMLTRLKQICNHPVHFLKEGHDLTLEQMEDRSGKLTRLTEMMEEVLEGGDRALIFTQYAEMSSHLERFLELYFDTDILRLTGDTPAEKRTEMVERFQSPRGASIFILSLKAGGTGLNLTNANHVFHYDRWYNPAVEDQATDRAFRIGQLRNVQVHKFICLGTLEEKIDELMERKRGLADKIVGDGEGWISEMSNDEIRDLVTLRRGAFQV